MNDSKTVAIWSGPYEQGQWTDWVVHVKWSPHSDGLFEVWKNGTKLPIRENGGDRSHGQNKFDDGKGNYIRIDIFKWPWNSGWAGVPSQVDKRVMYYDEVRIADQSGSYGAVRPRP